MASSYSTSLKFQEIGSGEQSGVWGATTNTNLTLIEEAIAGVRNITMSNADYTLTNLNGVSDEARNMVLMITGTNSAIRKVIAPLVQKFYVIFNNTTGGYAITIGGATGSIITIPYQNTAQVYCDGTNFYSAQTGSAGDFTVNGNLTVTGNETEIGTLSAGTLGVSGNSTFTGTTTTTGTATFNGAAALNGATTVPTQAVNDNTTKAASTAFVQTQIGALTTVQNARQITNSGGWNVTPSGTKLYFNYNGTNVASLDSSGNLITLANITAYGTP